MLEVSLTGNRLSGKKMVASKFEEIGVPVFDSDTILKFILNHKFYFYNTLKKSLGYSPFDKNGNIDPDRILSDLDFDKVIDEVESDLMSAYDRFKRSRNYPYVIFKSSLIFERGWNKKFDIIINVFEPRKDRALKSKDRGGAIIDFYNRTKNEISEFKKNDLSTHVVHSYVGSILLNESILKIDEDIKQKINKLNSYASRG